MKTSRTWGFVAGLLALAACGGSGGGGGPFEGGFHAVRLMASVPVTSIASWGPAASDGDVLQIAFEHNVNGSLGAFGEEYDVAASGGAIALRDTGSGDEVYAGSVAAGENVFVAANLRAGDLPEVFAMTRRRSGASAADLSGSHHAVVFRGSDGSGFCSTGRVTFDGVSSASLGAGASVNADGSVSPSVVATAFSYAVAPDGGVTLDAALGPAFQGGLDPSGTLLVLAGSTTAGEDPLAFFLVKDATSASVATFSGTYGMVGMVFDYTPDDFRCFAGVLTADGAGSATFQGTANVEGGIAPTLAAPCTYSVAADGTLTLVTPEGTFVGGIDESGDYAVVGGPTSTGDDPGFDLLVRR